MSKINLTYAIRDWLDQILQPEKYSDYCYNGLQVENSGKVNKIAAAVTASQEAIELAVKENVDLLIVHHGLFWKGDDLAVNGLNYKRLQALINNDIALIAYHLPLDEHNAHGNNVLMGQALGIPVSAQRDLGLMQPSLGRIANVNTNVSDLSKLLSDIMQQAPQHFAYGSDQVQVVAWCTGAAQDGILQAHKLGADTYISGEVNERSYHYARELGMHYFAAGHHASERFGVISVANAVAAEFNLPNVYLELANPV